MSETKHVPTIIVDTREKTPWIFKKCTKTNGSIVQKLDTGDYTIMGLESQFIIERKSSAQELYTCMGKESKRFFNELERLKTFKYRFLFLEFSPNDIYEMPNIAAKYGHYAMMSPDYIVSKLMEIEFEYGVKIVFIGSMRKAEDKHRIKCFINHFLYKFYNMYMENRLDAKPSNPS